MRLIAYPAALAKGLKQAAGLERTQMHADLVGWESCCGGDILHRHKRLLDDRFQTREPMHISQHAAGAPNRRVVVVSVDHVFHITPPNM